MLKNAYSLAKIGADTAENEQILPNNWQLPWVLDGLSAGKRELVETDEMETLTEAQGPENQLPKLIDQPDRVFSILGRF